MKEDFFLSYSFIINDSTVIKFCAIKFVVSPNTKNLDKTSENVIYPTLNANNLILAVNLNHFFFELKKT
jgi:hypothetical protein